MKAEIVIRIDISMERCYSHVEEVVYYRIQPLESWSRWIWYYEYLASLLKVNNPKRKVTLVMCNKDFLTGDLYIEKKRTDLLMAKKGQLKKLLSERVSDDLFGFVSDDHSRKINTVRDAIKALEDGRNDFYIPSEYINNVKKWVRR